MKKLFLVLASILLLCSCGSVESPAEPDAEIVEKDAAIEVGINDLVKNLLDSTPDYVPAWNKETFKGRWNYIDGVFLKSILELYKNTNDSQYLGFVTRYVNYYIDEDGNFLSLKEEPQDPYVLNDLDSVCESNILFDLYKYTNDERYKKAIENTYYNLTTYVTRLPDGICYSHKGVYLNQVWLDGFYMYAPFTVKYANSLSDNNKKQAIYDDLYNQYKFVREHLYDEKKELYYHGYSYYDIFWAKENKCSESFWLRSNGWLLASLADVLEYYPSGNNRDYLVNMYKEALDGIYKYKDNNSNMFYQVIDKGGQGAYVSYDLYLLPLNNKVYHSDAYISNYLESSGSALVAYSFMKGANIGVLDNTYYNKGVAIYNGVNAKCYHSGYLNSICISAGLGPEEKLYRDGSFEYYLAEKVGANDAKGVGPLIMAYVETKK